MTLVLGVDGCPAGWCGVLAEPDAARARLLDAHIYPHFSDILASNAEIICIDIPIGLLDCPGPRGCDVLARRLLRPHGSRVFPAPSRRALAGRSYEEACLLNREAAGLAITRQAYNISHKIGEVDSLMTPALQERVLEVHPEVCFSALSGAPLATSKKRPSGRAERWSLLGRVLSNLPESCDRPPALAAGWGTDDYLDALVAAWTGICVARNKALRIPDPPALDDRGLRMEMWLPQQKD